MEECAIKAPNTERENLKHMAVKYTTEAKENAQKLGSSLQQKREGRKRNREDNTPNEPASKRTRLKDIPDALRSAIETILSEQKVYNNNMLNATTHPKTHSTNIEPKQPTPPQPPIPKRKRKGKRQKPWKRWQELKKGRHAISYKKKKYKKNKLLSKTSNHISNNIVNLSKYTLSNHEISVLGKGLSFIPKPKHVDTDDIKNGIAKLKHQMIAKTETRQRTTLLSTIPDTYNPWQTIRALI